MSDRNAVIGAEPFDLQRQGKQILRSVVGTDAQVGRAFADQIFCPVDGLLFRALHVEFDKIRPRDQPVQRTASYPLFAAFANRGAPSALFLKEKGLLTAPGGGLLRPKAGNLAAILYQAGKGFGVGLQR